MKLLDKFISTAEVEKDIEDISLRKANRKRKSLKKSISEGALSSFSLGTITTYITPFALALKSNPFQIGFLTSIAGIASPISQIFGSHLMEKHPRKKIVLRFVLLEMLMLIPIISLALFYWKGLFQEYLSWMLILVYTLLVITSGAILSPWFSWLGDLVPEKDRGKYFGIRNRAMGFVKLAALLTGALILDAFKTKGIALIGFATLFSIALIFRFMSYLKIKQIYSPKFKLKKRQQIKLKKFIFEKSNYKNFAVYQGLLYFALMFASPFFTIYMLENLKFSYVTFTAVMVSAQIFYLISAPIIGKFSDKFGNVRLLYIANACYIISAGLWLFLDTPLTIILIPQLFAGIGNAALIIGAMDFTYEMDTQKRSALLSYSNLFIGIGTSIGAITGGFFLNYILGKTTQSYLILFGTAAILRLIIGIIFLPRIKEEKQTETLPLHQIEFIHPSHTAHPEIGLIKRSFSPNSPHQQKQNSKT